MNNMTSRTPLILILAATLLLAAIGAYLFWPKDSMSVHEPAGAAAQDAAKAAAAAGMSADDRKATEAIVRAYILENPEIITEAIGVLQKREATQRLSAAGSKLTEPFPGAEFGNPNGDVTLVEFTDYNCGYCRSSVADVQKLIDSDSNIRVVIREVPILSATSRDAALWALAAAKQGKYKAFHDAMFSGGRPDDQSIRAAALKAGMNPAAAEKFARSREAIAEVESNLAIMQQVGFGGTPTFIIGDQILEGAVGFDALKAAVAKARKAG
jgi:protein-disulfide isomerase